VGARTMTRITRKFTATGCMLISKNSTVSLRQDEINSQRFLWVQTPTCYRCDAFGAAGRDFEQDVYPAFLECLFGSRFDRQALSSYMWGKIITIFH